MPDPWVIGVDVGGTKLIAGAVDRDLQVHHRIQRPAPSRDQAAVFDGLARAVADVQAEAAREIAAVGFGIPCMIDRRRGVAVMSIHLPLDEVPFAALMGERLELPVFADNDANLAMLAEHRAGAARGANHAVMLTLGTGIGGGLIIDGELYRGSVGAGAELGHMVIDENGPPCQGNCPNRGCLEVMASGTALAREGLRVAEEIPGSALGRALAAGREITGMMVTELAHDGDPESREAVEVIGTHLGVGICSLVNIFNPEVVVVGGGVIAAGELLLEPARRVVAERALRPARDLVRIERAAFGAESGMVGAAALALEGIGLRAAA